MNKSIKVCNCGFYKTMKIFQAAYRTVVVILIDYCLVDDGGWLTKSQNPSRTNLRCPFFIFHGAQEVFTWIFFIFQNHRISPEYENNVIAFMYRHATFESWHIDVSAENKIFLNSLSEVQNTQNTRFDHLQEIDARWP